MGEDTRSMHGFRALLAGIVSVLLACTTLVASSAPAQAAPATGFNPGNIISDELFYDGSAMTAAEVQTFLNSAIDEGKCTIGQAGRKPGQQATINGYTFTVAQNCLKDAKFDTSTRVADQYCETYRGVKGETAAQIITKVAQACSISPKVLMVMLQKEQSLVQDNWPSTRMFDVAMGYACPDSGPGNSANCDSQYYGFFNQLYWGARQIQRYKTHYQSFNYQPFRNNTIQWHPTVSCGTSQVYIENWATAALYIYTPYRPNQAALNAGWGVGNSCSSYGNRNFYNYYKAWFGSTQTSIPVTGAILAEYEKNPARYGQPVSTQRAISQHGGGFEQRFEKGIITTSNTLKITRGSGDNGSFYRAYLETGGAAGPWGFIAADATGVTASGTREQRFQNGTAIYTSERGVAYLPTRLYTAWQHFGRHTGALGFPTAAASLPTATSGSQRFEKGVLMVSGNARTVVSYPELEGWQALGGFGAVGLYTADKISHSGGVARTAEKGTAYFPNGSDAVFLAQGPILTSYSAAGGPGGQWGWPLRGAVTDPATGETTVRFEYGVATQRGGSAATFAEGQASSLTIEKKPATAQPPVSAPSTAGLNTTEQAMVSELNALRISYCLPELRANAALHDLARTSTGKLVAQGRSTAHTLGTGSSVPSGWSVAGENIAAGQRTEGEMLDWWLDEATADSNILNPNLTDVGVSYRSGTGHYGNYGTQLFAGYSAALGGSFLDARPWHKFYKEIQWMADSGTSTGSRVDGCQNAAIYRSYDSVTREAMVAFLYRLNAPANYKPPARSPFSDVQPGHQFYTQIMWAYENGVTTGIRDGNTLSFKPKQPITREAMAAFLYRIYKDRLSAPANSARVFTDVPRSHTFYTHINWMAANGITTGSVRPDGSFAFRPKDQTTREATAAFLYRAE